MRGSPKQPGSLTQWEAELAGSFHGNNPSAHWPALDRISYYFACMISSPSSPAYSFSRYPDFLPLPLDAEPAQQEVLAGTNAIRASMGAAPRSLSEVLCRAAMIVRTTEMALDSEITHTRPNGAHWSTVLQGYASATAKNTAVPTTNLAIVGPTAVEMRKNSPGHHRQHDPAGLHTGRLWLRTREERRAVLLPADLELTADRRRNFLSARHDAD